MKQLLYLLLVIPIIIVGGREWNSKADKSARKKYPLLTEDIQVRDPFVFLDPKSKLYYVHFNDSYRLSCYESKDLEHWRFCGKSFVPSNDFWGKEDFWAPDIYYYRNRYYIFATFSSNKAKRGTSILVSDCPSGPFEPLVNYPITPPDQTCLDGSLYVDENDKPWLLYSHEWIEVGDGEICAVRLSEDLTHTEGPSKIIFCASDAPWTGTLTYSKVDPPVKGKVTDAPYIYRLEDGRLLMLWSSFQEHTGLYAIGQAISEGGLFGPWEHLPEPLNDDDGGHAMIFEDLEGNMKISYHAPNHAPSRPVIRNVEFNGTRLQIK